MNRLLPAVLVALALVLPLGSRSASAHAFLLTSDPAADAMLSAPPEWVTLTFDIYPARGTTVAVLDEAGNDLSSGPVVRDADRAAAPLWPLAPGRYTVHYTVVSSDDGHESTGSFQFTVLPPQEP